MHENGGNWARIERDERASEVKEGARGSHGNVNFKSLRAWCTRCLSRLKR